MLPLIIGLISKGNQLSTRDLGALSSIYMAGFLIASISAMVWVQKVRWRYVLGFTLVINSIGMLLLTEASTFEMLAVAFFLCGCVTGANGGIANQVFGSSENPERSFSVAFMVAFTSQALLTFFVTNYVVPEFGRPGLVGFVLAISCLLYFVGILLMPPNVISGGRDGLKLFSLLRPPKSILVGLFSITLFQAGWTGIWTFIGVIASAHSIPDTSTGQVLSSGLVIIAAGSFAANRLGQKLGVMIPILFAIIIAITSTIILVSQDQVLLFALAVVGFCFSWGFGVPYLLAHFSKADIEGRYLVLIGVCQAGGSMIGPAFLGLLSLDANISRIGLGGVTLFALTIGLVLIRSVKSTSA